MRVVPYDPDWPKRFAAERAVLERTLAPWLEGGVHHIGSTSVPGLAAKPIVDMLAGVRDLEEARAAFGPLEALGYTHRPHRPEAHLFVRQGYGVHLTVPGSALWRERLAFRDALRADQRLRNEYAAWKQANADRERPGFYIRNKRPLIEPVLARAGIDLKPDEERLDPAALAARRR